MRKCTICKEIKELTTFKKSKNKPLGYDTLCKKCHKHNTEMYYRTKPGLMAKIYTQQTARSRRKGWPKPGYTLEQLRLWMNNLLGFTKLYDDWVNSGHNRLLIPSVDRIDDHGYYTMDNIQLMTYDENTKKGMTDIRAGRNTKQSKAVIQNTLDDEFIKEFPSISMASRKTSIAKNGIISCCKGKHGVKQAGGFKWKYK